MWCGINSKSCGDSEKGDVIVQMCLCRVFYFHTNQNSHSSERGSVFTQSEHIYVPPKDKVATTSAAEENVLDINVLASVLLLQGLT